MSTLLSLSEGWDKNWVDWGERMRVVSMSVVEDTERIKIERNPGWGERNIRRESR